MFTKTLVLAALVAVAFATNAKRSSDDKITLSSGKLSYETIEFPKEQKSVSHIHATPVVTYEVPVAQKYVKTEEIPVAKVKSAEVVPTITQTIPLEKVAHEYSYFKTIPVEAQQYAVMPQQQYYQVVPQQQAYYYYAQQPQYYTVPQYVKYVR